MTDSMNAEFTLIIDPTIHYQNILGFGASAAWWAQDVGGWENGSREEIVNLLFSRETGIGLTILRYNIGGGDGLNIEDPWRKAVSFEIGKDVYDWNRDSNTLRILHSAHQKGVDTFVGFVNSPTARMTISGLTTGENDGKSNLNPTMVDDFVNYMVDVMEHLIEEEQLPFRCISPINEPQWNWSYKNGQEGCHYATEEIVEVTRVLIEKINNRGLDIEISVPESAEWKTSSIYLDRLMEDPLIAQNLHHFDVHSYWSTSHDKKTFTRYFQEKFPNLVLWMSEWTEMTQGRDVTMHSAMVMANTIHDDLTIGSVESWQYWIAVSKYDFHDGLIYVFPTKQEYEVTKRLWVFGNYSKFILPGFARVESSSEITDIRISAYISQDEKQLVLVVINNFDNAQQISLEINGNYFSMDGYLTDETHDLENVYSGNVLKAFLFPPQSVITFVLDQT